MDSKSENGNYRVVLLPWLASSHIAAFLELAKRMSNNNFHVYICSTPIHFPSMKKHLGEKYAESVQLVDINMPSSPEFPPHFHTTNGLPPHLKNKLIFAYEECRPSFTTILENLKPRLIVYDAIQLWAVEAASSFNIPCVQFIIWSATQTVVFLQKFALKQIAEQNPVPIPGFNIEEYQITSTKEDDEEQGIVKSPPEELQRVGRAHLLSMLKSHEIILVKSTSELEEGKFFDFISQTVQKKVLPVGPLFPESLDNVTNDEHIEIFRWLNQKKQASVVYICFGAEYYLSKTQIEAIAYGLEHSNVKFIWVLRFPGGDENNKTIEEVLPKGFVERIGDKGMFITWAPQTRILDHKSTGAFFCHCGWVSVLESIYYGVPIIGWPMQYDHPCNAKLIEKLGIGIIVGRSKDKKVEMAESINKVMTDDGPREKMHNLSQILREKGHQEVDNVVTNYLVKMCDLNMSISKDDKIVEKCIMGSRSESKRFRVVMLPCLAYSHISCFVGFAKRLTNHNFYIYMCSSTINLQYIKKKLLGQKCSEFIQLVEFNLPSSSNLPLEYQTTNGLPPQFKKTLGDDYDKSGPDFANIILKNIRPHLVIYDYNQWWAAEAASSLNIPSIQFWSGSVAFCTLAVHFLSKEPHEKYPFPEIRPKHHKRGDNADPDDNSAAGEVLIKSIKRSCEIILVRSTTELEGKYIDYMSQTHGKKLLPVGPLVEESSQQDVDQYNAIISWLDNKEDSSVVFVSFGSEYFLSANEIQDIAYGLEVSQVSFIWVIRFPDNSCNLEQLLPNGFLERVGDHNKGLVIEKWAPQAKILSHPSTGGFISHCGWGSVMESVGYGVPIIAMPMQFDQPYNARLVEAVGVGIEVGRDEEGRLKREEMAKVVRKVVMDDSGAKIRAKAKELGRVMSRKTDEGIDGVLIKNLVRLCEMSK